MHCAESSKRKCPFLSSGCCLIPTHHHLVGVPWSDGQQSRRKDDGVALLFQFQRTLPLAHSTFAHAATCSLHICSRFAFLCLLPCSGSAKNFQDWAIWIWTQGGEEEENEGISRFVKTPGCWRWLHHSEMLLELELEHWPMVAGGIPSPRCWRLLVSFGLPLP
jgi:hypothetical protein